MAQLPPQAPRAQAQPQQRPPAVAAALQQGAHWTPQRASSPPPERHLSLTPGMHQRSPHAQRSPTRQRSLTPPPSAGMRSSTPRQQLKHSQSVQPASMEPQRSMRSLTPTRQAQPPSQPHLSASYDRFPKSIPISAPGAPPQAVAQTRLGHAAHAAPSYAPACVGSYVAQPNAATGGQGQSCAAPATVCQGSPNPKGHAASQSFVPVIQGSSAQAPSCPAHATPAKGSVAPNSAPATQKYASVATGSYVAQPGAKGSYVAQPGLAQGVSASQFVSAAQGVAVAQALPASQSYLPAKHGSYVAQPREQGSYVAQPHTPPAARPAPVAQVASAAPHSSQIVVANAAQAVVVTTQIQLEHHPEVPRGALTAQASRGALAVREALERQQAKRSGQAQPARPGSQGHLSWQPPPLPGHQDHGEHLQQRWAQPPSVQPEQPPAAGPNANGLMQLPPSARYPRAPEVSQTRPLQQASQSAPQHLLARSSRDVQGYLQAHVVTAEQVKPCPRAAEKVDALTTTQEIYVYQKTPESSPKGGGGVAAVPEACGDISFAGELMEAGADDGGASVVIQSGKVLTVKEVMQSAFPIPVEPPERDIAQCLVEAAQEGDLESLSEHLRRAVSASVDPALVEWAHCRKKVLEEESWSLRVHSTASQALQEALGGECAESLRAAVERAHSAGVTGSLIEGARKELGRLQGRQHAEEELYAALQDVARGVAGARLPQAIAGAEAAGVSAELVSHARRQLSRVEEYACIRQASSAAEQKLRDIMSSCKDVGVLTAVLEEAQQAGVCYKVIDGARKRKAELEDQAWQAQSHDLAGLRPCAAAGELAAAALCTELAPCAAAVACPTEEVAEGESTPASTIGIGDELLERICAQKSEFDRPSSRPISPIEADERACDPWPEALPSTDAAQAARRRSATPPAPAVSHPPAPEPAGEPAALQETSVAEASAHDPSFAQQTPVSERRQPSLAEDAPTPGQEARMTPAPRSSWEPKSMTDELPIYGLDAELKAKADAKYDMSAEDQAAQWVQDITGVEVKGDFGASLRTGQVLCELVNYIRPGTIAKINRAGMPFKERENISQFLRICREWGVHEYALFSTDDLYDEKNLSSVVKCIHQLGGVLRRTVPEFEGPHLGVADTSNAKRDQKRALEQASQTGGLRVAMDRSHVDVVSTANVRAPTRGGC